MTDPLQLPAIRDLGTLIQLLNRHHRTIVQRLDQLERNKDAGGQRLTGLGRSMHRNDALTRGELTDLLGDLDSPSMEVNVPVTATSGIRVPELLREPSGVVTVRRLKQEIMSGGAPPIGTAGSGGGDLEGLFPDPTLKNRFQRHFMLMGA